MSGAADRLRQQTVAIAKRDAAAAAPAEVDEVTARTESFRVSCDLPPDDYSDLLRWILEAAISTGRGSLTRQEALYWTIRALQDETVGRRVRQLIVSGEPAPLTRPKRRTSGGTGFRTPGGTEVRRS